MSRYTTINEIKDYWQARGCKSLIDIIGVPYSSEHGKIVIYVFGKKKSKALEDVKRKQLVGVRYEHIFRSKLTYYIYKIFRYKLF